MLFQRTLAIRAIPVFLTVLAFGGTLSAQETRGQILGRVLDPAGAIVVGAKVEAVNTATNVANTTQTNATGDYVLPFLIPGSYTVTAELTGFKKSLRQGIIVQVNDRVSVDFALELGRTTKLLKFLQKQDPTFIRFTVDRMGVLAYVKFLKPCPEGKP